MSNEADTCRKQVVPKLQAAGWDTAPHTIAEQRSVTDGRIVPVGKGFVRNLRRTDAGRFKVPAKPRDVYRLPARKRRGGI